MGRERSEPPPPPNQAPQWGPLAPLNHHHPAEARLGVDPTVCETRTYLLPRGAQVADTSRGSLGSLQGGESRGGHPSAPHERILGPQGERGVTYVSSRGSSGATGAWGAGGALEWEKNTA